MRNVVESRDSYIRVAQSHILNLPISAYYYTLQRYLMQSGVHPILLKKRENFESVHHGPRARVCECACVCVVQMQMAIAGCCCCWCGCGRYA